MKKKRLYPLYALTLCALFLFRIAAPVCAQADFASAAPADCAQADFTPAAPADRAQADFTPAAPADRAQADFASAAPADCAPTVRDVGSAPAPASAAKEESSSPAVFWDAVVCVLTSRIENALICRRVERSLDAPIDRADAEARIDRILRAFSSEARVVFSENGDALRIIGSHTVTDRFARLKICSIIARTGYTDRTAHSLAAEWYLHNLLYDLGVLRDHTADVDLDARRDPRLTVRAASVIFAFLGWE